MSSALTTGSASYAQTYGERPSRGVVGIVCLILAESGLFLIFRRGLCLLPRREPQRAGLHSDVTYREEGPR